MFPVLLHNCNNSTCIVIGNDYTIEMTRRLLHMLLSLGGGGGYRHDNENYYKIKNMYFSFRKQEKFRAQGVWTSWRINGSVSGTSCSLEQSEKTTVTECLPPTRSARCPVTSPLRVVSRFLPSVLVRRPSRAVPPCPASAGRRPNPAPLSFPLSPYGTAMI